MPDYERMYGKLFNAITDAVEILQQAQRETEEIYIETIEKDEHRMKNLEEMRRKNIKIVDKKEEVSHSEVPEVENIPSRQEKKKEGKVDEDFFQLIDSMYKERVDD